MLKNTTLFLPPHLLEAERAAGAREVGRRNFHVWSKGNSAGGEQNFFSVDKHDKRAVRQARRHSGGAGAVQTVGVGHLDDDAAVGTVAVGGEDGQACSNRQSS